MEDKYSYKITQKARKKMYKDIELGIPLAIVARRNNITRASLYYWLRKERPSLINTEYHSNKSTA